MAEILNRINKVPLLRQNLLRIARNECDPPARIGDITNWTNSQIQNYISKYKVDISQPVQQPLLETNYILGSYTAELQRKIRKALSQIELSEIWNKNTNLHGNPKFRDDFFKKGKEFRK